MKIKFLYKITLIVIIITLISCSEEVLKENPPHLITSGSLYSDLDGFEAGLNGLYSLVRQERAGRDNSGNRCRTVIFMDGTDNITTNYQDSFSTIVALWGTRLNPEDPDLVNFYELLYSIINAANTIINQAMNRDDIDWTGEEGSAEQNMNRILAEARAIRAWAYRHLTYCWGDVILNLEESLGSTIKTDWKRTPVKQVRLQMKSDWLFAEKYLSVEPPVPGKISKGAVQHYLAELFLTMQQPDSALFWSNKCIDTPEYKLITSRYGIKHNLPGVPFMDMFYDGNSNREEGNAEALWVWQYEFETIGGGTNIMRRYHNGRWYALKKGNVTPLQFTLDRGGRGISRMALTKWALNLYEPQDHRASEFAIRTFFILQDATQNAPAPADRLPEGYNYGDTIKLDWSKDITSTYNNVPNWPYSRKWDGTPISNFQAGGAYNDQVYLRLGETYLLKAEAQFLLGYSEEAAKTINILRSRSNASPISPEQVNIDFILDERSRELVCEEHRRYTLLRTSKWLERVKLYNKRGGENVTERDTLFPFPQADIDANLSGTINQNPGY